MRTLFAADEPDGPDGPPTILPLVTFETASNTCAGWTPTVIRPAGGEWSHTYPMTAGCSASITTMMTLVFN